MNGVTWIRSVLTTFNASTTKENNEIRKSYRSDYGVLGYFVYCYLTPFTFFIQFYVLEGKFNDYGLSVNGSVRNSTIKTLDGKIKKHSKTKCK